MNRAGSVAIAILCIALVLAIAGGIAYVHYVYLPQMAAQDNATQQTTSTAPVAPPPPTPTTTTPVPMGSAGTTTCAANDLNCFIAAAKTCSPVSMEWTQTISLFDIFNQTSQVHLALGGLNGAGKCSFSERTDSLSLALTAQEGAQAKAQGVTDAQIQVQIASSTAAAQQQSVGISIACTLTTSNLVQILTNWSKGNFSSSDLAAGNCISTLPNGTKMPLNTGGSVQLTPSTQTPPPTVAPPSGVGVVTTSLYPNEVSSANGVQFKTTTITATTMNVTVVDPSGNSATVALTVNQPTMVLGYDMVVTNIVQTSEGTQNGQPILVYEATLSYK